MTASLAKLKLQNKQKRAEEDKNTENQNYVKFDKPIQSRSFFWFFMTR